MPLRTPCAVLSVASAFPDTVVTQKQIGDLLQIQNPVVLRLLQAPHHATRRLLIPSATQQLPATNGDENSNVSSPHCSALPSRSTSPLGMSLGSSPSSVTSSSPLGAHISRSELNDRFLQGLETIGVEAAQKALAKAGVNVSSIDYVVGVTSTGLAMPGFSAILTRALNLSPNVERLDVVGMGCNAGMSALRTTSRLLASDRPGVTGLMVCCEICSAMYVAEDSAAAGIVNSLFGDGAVAVVLQSEAPTISSASGTSSPVVTLSDFESCTLTEFTEDMKYIVPPQHDRMCFQLSKRIPFVVGDNVHVPVRRLLARMGKEPSDVAHWVVHTGGAAVIEGVCRTLGLSKEALRHTTSVLRDYGNISSGSFLASYERLLEEHQQSSPTTVLHDGDLVVMIAMGPGATIEVGAGVVGHR